MAEHITELSDNELDAVSGGDFVFIVGGNQSAWVSQNNSSFQSIYQNITGNLGNHSVGGANVAAQANSQSNSFNQVGGNINVRT